VVEKEPEIIEEDKMSDIPKDGPQKTKFYLQKSFRDKRARIKKEVAEKP
jgi:hypothetical protein